MGRVIVSTCLAVAIILCSRAAIADTRIYLNLGPPVVHLRFGDRGPCGDHIWIEGYYLMYGPSYVWVPGYWVPAAYFHSVYVKRPRGHRHYHGIPPGNGYARPPHHYGDRHQGHMPRGHGSRGAWGNSPSHGPHRHGVTNGNWMNNIRHGRSSP